MNQSVNWPIYQYIIQSIDHTATNDLLNISDCQYKTIPWLVLVVPQDVHDLQISAVINYHAIEFAMWANGKHEGRVSQSNILVKKRQIQRNLNLSFFLFWKLQPCFNKTKLTYELFSFKTILAIFSVNITN